MTGEKFQVNLRNRRLNTLFRTIVQRSNTGRTTNGLVKSSISSYFDPVFRGITQLYVTNRNLPRFEQDAIFTISKIYKCNSHLLSVDL